MTEKGFHGSPGPVMRQKAKGTRPERNKARMMARRHILPGYPIDPRPFALEEIREYFSGNRILCLLCGKPYKRLAMHLPRCHSVTEDEYRKMYGLPWGRGLTSQSSHEAHSRASIRCGHGQRLSEATDINNWREKAWQAARKQRTQPFRLEISQSNLSKIQRQSIHYPNPDELFDEVIRHLTLGKSLTEIGVTPGLPSSSWVGEFKRKNPLAQKRYEDVVNNLPYVMQAKLESLGSRFWTEVVNLRNKGLSDHRISAQTGVSAMSINRGRRKRGIA